MREISSKKEKKINKNTKCIHTKTEKCNFQREEKNKKLLISLVRLKKIWSMHKGTIKNKH